MKVFVDTNVILDYILQREHYTEAKRAIAQEVAAQDTLLMSVGGFYTMLYVVDKYFRKEFQQNHIVAVAQTRDVMRKVLSLFTVAEHDNTSLLNGLNDLTFHDLEDSCQYQLAVKHGCKKLLTFNTSDYPADTCKGLEIVAL
jgi:predicted nucleic acid-binding protein